MQALLDQIALSVRVRNPIMYLLTHEEDRVERSMARLAERESAGLWRWRVSEGLRNPEGTLLPDTTGPVELLAELEEVQGPAFFLVEDFHPFLGDPTVVRRLRDLAALLGGRRQGLLIVAPVLRVPRELEKDIVVLDVSLPSRDEIGALLRAVLGRRQVEVKRDLLDRYVRAARGLTEREVKRCFSHILLSDRSFDEAGLSAVMEAKRQAIRRSRYLEFVDDAERMEGVGGMGNLKEWLSRRAAAFSDEARAFGLPEPRGLFLLGVQGCGKSLMAKAVAGLFQVPLLRLDVAEVFRRQGLVEEGLHDAIRVAESISPAVMWIDELEKAFLGEGGGGRPLGHLLTWLQEHKKPVFVVATANEVRLLPPELLRKGRFDEIFFVDLPDVHERLEILEIHLRKRSRSPADFDLLTCAEESEKYSGAELEQVVVEALFNAYAEARELHTRDLLRVLRDTVPLAVTMDDRLKELREWARPRTRPASVDRRRIDFFQDFEQV